MPTKSALDAPPGRRHPPPGAGRARGLSLALVDKNAARAGSCVGAGGRRRRPPGGLGVARHWHASWACFRTGARKGRARGGQRVRGGREDVPAIGLAPITALSVGRVLGFVSKDWRGGREFFLFTCKIVIKHS
jgi:hypothetical protein